MNARCAVSGGRKVSEILTDSGHSFPLPTLDGYSKDNPAKSWWVDDCYWEVISAGWRGRRRRGWYL